MVSGRDRQILYGSVRCRCEISLQLYTPVCGSINGSSSSNHVSSTVYWDHLDFLSLPQNELKVYFVRSRQDWLGIAKPEISSDQP